ncbi:MAG: hypothetical protein ABJQ34_05770 [Paracoccaceae bacterium]
MIAIDAQPQDVPGVSWLDMVFEITSFVNAGDKSTVQLAALDGAALVGVEFSVPNHWATIFDSDGQPTKQLRPQAVTMVATKNSPALAQYLSRWSDVEASEDGLDYDAEKLPEPDYAKGQIPLNAVYLGEVDKTIDHGPTRLKLFHEHEPYFEAFLTLDPDRGYAALNEKDPDYRNAFRSVLISNFQSSE